MMRIISSLGFLCLSVFDISAQPYTISTVAGTARLLDGGNATSAPLREPRSVAIDAAGNLYIADTSDNRIRKVNFSGIISTYGGTGAPGYSGDRGQATVAELSGPTGVAVDGSGNVYVADGSNNRIQKLDTSGNYVQRATRVAF